jgi:Uma2 family endonuclease
MVKPGYKHGRITMRIAGPMHVFVETHDLGEVMAAETGYILHRDERGRDTVRGIDIGFIAKARLPQSDLRGHYPGAPDLAVEVVSPGNEAADMHQKIRELLRGGCRLIWIVYPDTQTVEVHTSAGAHTLEIDAALDGGEVLPGFTLPLRQVFRA